MLQTSVLNGNGGQTDVPTKLQDHRFSFFQKWAQTIPKVSRDRTNITSKNRKYKFESVNNIIDTLMPPLTAGELVIAYTAGGITRGITVGITVSLVLAFFVAVIVGVVSGIYPAYRAALLDPIVALRSL